MTIQSVHINGAIYCNRCTCILVMHKTDVELDCCVLLPEPHVKTTARYNDKYYVLFSLVSYFQALD